MEKISSLCLRNKRKYFLFGLLTGQQVTQKFSVCCSSTSCPLWLSVAREKASSEKCGARKTKRRNLISCEATARHLLLSTSLEFHGRFASNYTNCYVVSIIDMAHRCLSFIMLNRRFSVTDINCICFANLFRSNLRQAASDEWLRAENVKRIVVVSFLNLLEHYLLHNFAFSLRLLSDTTSEKNNANKSRHKFFSPLNFH